MSLSRRGFRLLVGGIRIYVHHLQHKDECKEDERLLAVSLLLAKEYQNDQALATVSTLPPRSTPPALPALPSAAVRHAASKTVPFSTTTQKAIMATASPPASPTVPSGT